MIYLQLYLEFCKIGLVCVGGGYASMPLIQNVVVDTYHWMTISEFIDIFTISQMTPGPVGINAATFCGSKVAGVPGSILATMGFVSPALIICIIVMFLLKKYGEITSIKAILSGLRPAVTALMSVAAISFITLTLWDSDHIPQDTLDIDLKAAIILVIAYILVRKKMSVIRLLILSGIMGLISGILFQ